MINNKNRGSISDNSSNSSDITWEHGSKISDYSTAYDQRFIQSKYTKVEGHFR